MKKGVNVVFGGWYQRTTLHLSEVHRFLLGVENNINLPAARVKKFRDGLELKSVKRKVGYLEFLDVQTKGGIRIRYFEDGLYLLSKKGSDVHALTKEIKDYFSGKFEPAINFLFSLGAPTPKILSNMKATHPVVVERVVEDPLKSKVGREFGKVYLETSSSRIKVSKTKEYIVVDVASSRKKELDTLTEMQIFFSDFKLQLHKYLDIHRKIWEEIDAIGEKEFVRGREVGEYKSMLNSYQKTIQLVKNRINQMSNYARTRRDISKQVNIDRRLNDLFQYRFEDLFNTLEYIKEVWAMTLDYVNSAIRVIQGVEKQVSSKGLGSIQFLVGVGVISGIIRYLGPASFPDVAVSGFLYVLGFGVLAIVMNKVMNWNGKKKKYKVKFVERAKKI
jgi:hypothetical protein